MDIGERLDELYALTTADYDGGGVGLYHPVPVPERRYDDFPPVTTHSISRAYTPSVYGFHAGTLWPVTDADAQAGRHREPPLEDAFPSLEM